MSLISEFIDRITNIAEFLNGVMRAKSTIPRTAKLIDTAIDEKWPVVEWIEKAIAAGIPKTPSYQIHRGKSAMAGKQYRGKIRPLSKKERMRKQDFLALYEYLAKEEIEEEIEEELEEEPVYFRTSRTAAKYTRRNEHSERQEVELRIWIYHTEPLSEDELDEEWSSAIAFAILATSSELISALQITADELNEEVDEDEISEIDEWEGTLCFDSICYGLDSDFRETI